MKILQLKQNRRFLVVLPALVIPFLCLAFYTLDGGKGESAAKNKTVAGLNTQLPTPTVDPSHAFEDKAKAYKLAENDSLRKMQYQREDPYRRDTASMKTAEKATVPPPDTRSTQLLRQLDQLRQSLHSAPTIQHTTIPVAAIPEPVAHPAADPQLDRLNTMLDKILRIQHPLDQTNHTGIPSPSVVDHVGPADTLKNSLQANIPDNQTLTNGATIAIRITDSIRVNGQIVSPGQLVFGTVSFNNDRLLVRINSLREAANLYTVDWQVYDMDGLPGIHIPALLGRDIAKQSADQGVSSLNLITTDPSLGSQAAGAGIQAAKSFFGHKVRQVRVTVKAGYQVLLRNAHGEPRPQPAPVQPPPIILPVSPDFNPDGTRLARARDGGVELILRNIRIEDTCLWFGLQWKNHSSIDFTPAYARWCIRTAAGITRTAIQEQTLDPLVIDRLPVVTPGMTDYSWVGFRPFALAKGKQVLLLVSERSGERILRLAIDYHKLLNAKRNVTTDKPASPEACNGELH